MTHLKSRDDEDDICLVKLLNIREDLYKSLSNYSKLNFNYIIIKQADNNNIDTILIVILQAPSRHWYCVAHLSILFSSV